MLDSFLLVVEFDVQVRQGITSGGPAHKRIFPSLAVVEFHSPHLNIMSAALHCVLWWNKDTDTSFLHVLFWNAVDRCERFLKRRLIKTRNVINNFQFHLLWKWHQVGQFLAFSHFAFWKDDVVLNNWCLLVLQSIRISCCWCLNPTNRQNWTTITKHEKLLSNKF